jgi:hypothetical protein
MSVLSCIQPSYIPWKGYFHQIQKSDIFVFLDDVQYDKHSWRNRNKIKTSNGLIWLTVPVLTKKRFGQSIMEVQINNRNNWRKKHLKAIHMNYIKAPFFNKHKEFLASVYEREWKLLVDLDIYLTVEISKLLGIKTNFIRASEMQLKQDKIHRLIDLCKILNIDTYLTGPLARNYLTAEMFEKEGLKLEFQEYYYNEYPQLYGDFVHNVSIIDTLFNCGEEAGEYIWGKYAKKYAVSD